MTWGGAGISRGLGWVVSCVAVVGGLVLTTGCSTLRMIPPPDVTAQSDFLEVKRRGLSSGTLVDESFQLGPYKVANVRRGTDSIKKLSHVVEDVEVGRAQIHGAYSFEFKGGGDTLHGRCEIYTRRKSTSLGTLSSTTQDSRVNCICGSGDQAARLEMGADPRTKEPGGKLFLAGRTFELTPVKETNARWASQPGGFRVDDENWKPVGAVEILHPGGVWLSRSLDETERHPIGCLLAAVMLYDEPSIEDD